MYKKITALLVFMMALCVLLGLTFSRDNYVLSKIGQNHVLYAQNSSSNISAETTKRFPSKIKGETCVVMDDHFDLQYFLNKFNAEMVMIEEFDGGISYYAYSPRIKYLEILKGEKINLHIAVEKQGVKIGSPIIYASF